MKSKQSLEIKEKIEQEIKKTKNKIIDYKELTQPIAPDCAIGRVSRMDAINNKSVMESALRQAEKKLGNLYIALKLADSDNFGICERCGSDIPIQRILIIPQSRLCVNCAR